MSEKLSEAEHDLLCIRGDWWYFDSEQQRAEWANEHGIALMDALAQARLLNAECERQRKEAWEQMARLRGALRHFAEIGKELVDSNDRAAQHFIKAYRAMQAPNEGKRGGEDIWDRIGRLEAELDELREAVAAFLVTARCGIEDDGVPWIEVDHATLDRLKDVMEKGAI